MNINAIETSRLYCNHVNNTNSRYMSQHIVIRRLRAIVQRRARDDCPASVRQPKRVVERITTGEVPHPFLSVQTNRSVTQRQTACFRSSNQHVVYDKLVYRAADRLASREHLQPVVSALGSPTASNIYDNQHRHGNHHSSPRFTPS